MTILTRPKEEENEQYTIPNVFQHGEKEQSLKGAIVASTILHPIVVGIIWLLLMIAAFFGITYSLLQKPVSEPKDIEFVLVDREDTPINKHTRFRADKNSRAGGHHDPKRKVSMPQPAAGGGVKSTKPARANAPSANARKSASSAGRPVQKTEPARTYSPKPAPRPAVIPTAPRTVRKPKSNFVIPVPKTSIPKIGQPAGSGPIASSYGTGTGASGSGKNRSSLSFAPATAGSKGGSRSGAAGSGSGGTRIGYGSGSGNGHVGNPGPGNPNGRPGIDALKEPDFGPYMRELQQRIKRNWDPPRGEESRRVVLLFGISRDGRLTNVRVQKSSGLESADRAAIAAVKLTAPFRPLPAAYRENSVDIQFTFDYNVFGGRRY